MKINKTNPSHLKALAISGVFSNIASIVRPFIKKNKGDKEKIIIFYGHTLNGNLKTFYNYLQGKGGYRPYFLVLDNEYYVRLKRTADYPNSILSALIFSDMMIVAKADAFISSHGLHFFSILRRFTNIKFIDVWHGLGYKGQTRASFHHLRGYDETWVTSKYVKKRYIRDYGFKPQQVKLTGYSRVDQLVDGSLDSSEIKNKYKIPKNKKIILIAPTWKKEEGTKDYFPFENENDNFFTELDKLSQNNSSIIIFRSHINTTQEINMHGLKNILVMPYSKYENAEEFLYITDILITDWSSIAFDYMPLKRPVIFLDVGPPKNNLYFFGPEHRIGDVVTNVGELKLSIKKYLDKSELYREKYKKQLEVTTKLSYDNSLDGKSTHRYFKQLEKLLI